MNSKLVKKIAARVGLAGIVLSLAFAPNIVNQVDYQLQQNCRQVEVVSAEIQQPHHYDDYSEAHIRYRSGPGTRSYDAVMESEVERPPRVDNITFYESNMWAADADYNLRQGEQATLCTINEFNQNTVTSITFADGVTYDAQID